MKLLLRADADATIGLGHAMRCLALAEAWCDGGYGEAAFAMRAPIDSVRARIERSGVAVHALDGSLPALVRAVSPSVSVIDGYRFGDAEHAAMKAAGPLAVIDDNREVPLGHADVIINQNPHATASMYADVKASALTGLDYALLRRDLVRHLSESTPFRAEVGRVVITLGGSDPARRTATIVEAVGRVFAGRPLQLDVLVGPACPHGQSIDRAIARVCTDVLRASRHHGIEDMGAFFRGADLVLSAAGSTLWELLALGLPTLATVVASNQAALAQNLSERGAVVLGPSSMEPETSPERDAWTEAVRRIVEDGDGRAKLKELGPRLVDGHGASRVARHLFELARSFASSRSTP